MARYSSYCLLLLIAAMIEVAAAKWLTSGQPDRASPIFDKVGARSRARTRCTGLRRSQALTLSLSRAASFLRSGSRSPRMLAVSSERQHAACTLPLRAQPEPRDANPRALARPHPRSQPCCAVAFDLIGWKVIAAFWLAINAAFGVHVGRLWLGQRALRHVDAARKEMHTKNAEEIIRNATPRAGPEILMSLTSAVSE